MPRRQAVSCLYIGDWVWLADRARVKRHRPPAPVNYRISKCPKRGLGLLKKTSAVLNMYPKILNEVMFLISHHVTLTLSPNFSNDFKATISFASNFLVAVNVRLLQQ